MHTAHCSAHLISTLHTAQCTTMHNAAQCAHLLFTLRCTALASSACALRFKADAAGTKRASRHKRSFLLSRTKAKYAACGHQWSKAFGSLFVKLSPCLSVWPTVSSLASSSLLICFGLKSSALLMHVAMFGDSQLLQ